MPLKYDPGPQTPDPRPQKVGVYGALRVRDGQALTQTARSRNTAGYLDLLQALDRTYPTGDLYLIADNLASNLAGHTGGPLREWLEAHPRIQHAFLPVGAAWLNLIEGWWRLFRRKAFAGQALAGQALAGQAFAGQALADDHAIASVTRVATEHLNRHATPWVWGRLPTLHRVLRRRFVYCL